MIQLIEIVSGNDIKGSFLVEPNKTSEFTVTTDVEELVFGSVKITSDEQGNLILHDLSERDSNKELIIGPPPDKDRPPYPAGTKPKPPITVKPKH